MAVSTKPVIQSIKLLLDDVILPLKVLDQGIVLVEELTHQGPVFFGLAFKMVSLNAPLLVKLNCSNFKGTYCLMFTLKHCPQPHWHVISLPAINDPHLDQPDKLGFIWTQVPSSEQPFHKPINS